MILDLKNATQAELLAYINCYETNQSWRDLEISNYEEALSALWELLDKKERLNKLGMSIFLRLNYFSKCKNPSIDNMKLHLNQSETMCKLMCHE